MQSTTLSQPPPPPPPQAPPPSQLDYRTLVLLSCLIDQPWPRRTMVLTDSNITMVPFGGSLGCLGSIFVL
jgi:hypothetical protein